MISKIRFGEAVATPAASTTQTKQPEIKPQPASKTTTPADSITISDAAKDTKAKKEAADALKRQLLAKEEVATSALATALRS